jgi:RES domain-containing protein
MVEYFVHINPGCEPADLALITVAIPDSVSRQTIPSKQLPANWRKTPPPSGLTTIGDAFQRNRRSAILIVPSALAPNEANWLINPEHPHARKIRVVKMESFRYDNQFFT